MYYVRCSLKSKREEAKDIFSCTFSLDDVKFLQRLMPGRFVMVWLPGIDEFPLSPSDYNVSNSTLRLTFKVRGLGTRSLSSLSVGSSIFIRGPYGNGFKVSKHILQGGSKLVLVAGGGIGLAPLIPLIKDLLQQDVKLHVVCGFRSSNEVFFINEITNLLGDSHTVSTDDGSLGVKGTVVDVVQNLLNKRKVSYVYACGPEMMLYKLHRVLLDKGVPHQMSVERYVKCALGICGACVIDGLRLCKEGPVFNDVHLKGLKEFGRYKRNASGVREPLL